MDHVAFDLVGTNPGGGRIYCTLSFETSGDPTLEEVQLLAILRDRSLRATAGTLGIQEEPDRICDIESIDGILIEVG